jgi:hypothetical protein
MPETCDCIGGVPPSEKLAGLFCVFKEIAEGGGTPPSPVPDILWWKFGEGSGTSIGATVGPNGTTDAAWVVGKSGSGFALEFNGTTQDANSTSPVTYAANIITVCAWLWFDAAVGPYTVFESSTNFAATPNTFAVRTFGVTAYTYNAGATGYLEKTWATAGATGTWVHLAVVFSPTDTKPYVNGVEMATTIGTNTRTGTANYSAQPLFVGASNNSIYFMDGRVDDLRIYSGDRSADIAAIMADPQ